MDLKTAQKMNEHLSAMIKHANDALFVANNSGDDVLKTKTQLAFASAIAEIDLNVWELIYSQHPVLRPPDMVAINRPDD